MTDTTNAAMATITCSECGKDVPENNMTIHLAHACQGRARSAATATASTGDDNNDNDDVIDLTSSNKKREDPSTPPPSRRQRRAMGRLKRDDDYNSDTNNNNNDDDAMDIDDDDDSIEVVENCNNDVVEIDDDDDDEWACPRCTLLNDNATNLCSMCGGTKDGSSAPPPSTPPPRGDGVRAPDAVRRERLIGGNSPSGLSNNSPLSVVGGGALIGGLVGGMNAYMRGRPVSSGALEGGVAGAVGGAFLAEYNGTPERHAARRSSSHREFHNDMAEARSSGVSGQPSYPSMGTAASRRSTRQPRSSIRVTTLTNPDGSRRVMVSESNRSSGSLRYGIHSQNPGDTDPLMSFLLASSLRGGPGARAATTGHRSRDGLDNMNYEQLLSAFGDGTENLGASGRCLSSLPTHIVKAKADGTIDLPQDARQCAICLEDFEQGETRKTLPCLHGFHENCVDKWCTSNGCCPVCKYRVDQSSS